MLDLLREEEQVKCLLRHLNNQTWDNGESSHHALPLIPDCIRLSVATVGMLATGYNNSLQI